MSTIERVETITSDDVAGLVGTETQPTHENVEQQVRRAIAERSARMRAFLAAVAPMPEDGKVWVPTQALAMGGGVQPGEKVVFPDSAVDVGGKTWTPDLVGAAWNVSWQVWQQAQRSVEVLLLDLALRRAVDYIVSRLQTEALVNADIDAAIAQVEQAGFPVDFVAGSTSQLLGLDVVTLDVIGVRLFGGLPVDGLLIGSLSGVYGSIGEFLLRVTEPAIGGYEVSAFAEALIVPAVGSIAYVPAAEE